MEKDFPINVFPDVERNAFKKYTKKNVTEDYIKENLKRKGWECFKPFSDTGIDLVATKITNNIRIWRYIQIKTRALVEDFFGYTLTPKDFLTDPRKFYCFYCDTTDDVILISTYDYLKMCDDHYGFGESHFANPAFRTYNNKINSLTYNQMTKTWSMSYSRRGTHPGGVINFDEYLNDAGLKKMGQTDIDTNLDEYLKKTTELKFKLFYRFNRTRGNQELFDGITDTNIIDSLNKTKTRSNSDYVQLIKRTEHWFKTNHPDLYESHLKYEKDEGGNDDD